MSAFLNRTYYLITFLACIFVSTCLLGQDTGSYMSEDVEHREFDNDRWEKTVDGMKFSDEKPEKVEENTSDPVYFDGSFFGDGRYVRYIFYGIFIIFFLFLMYRLLTNRFTLIETKLKPKRNYSIEDVEENLHESDLERFLRESLEQKNFRQAIRMYYLMIIKELSQLRWINWKKEKTNFDYLREMREKSVFPSFRNVTRIFDKVWYGETEVNEPDYNRLKNYFEKLLKAIRN
ncbi:MAG: DUF4129 domain-containing protein [Bacteroidota bacterium]